MKDKLIIITGSTASGKSDIAIKVAKTFNGEVISCDSQQIYKDMDIGTNKESDFRGIKHHMIDIINPNENFTVEDFSSLVKPIVHDINNNGNIPILTGGTGFYIDSLLFEMNYGNTPKDPKIRKKLQDISDSKGNSFLYNKLKELDPKTADKYHENESQRIIRALEIYEMTGKKPSELRKGERVLNNTIDPILFFLNYEDRSKLYENINNRVIKMLDAGLINEFVSVIKKYKLTKDSQSMAAIGYKELFSYFDKEIDIDELIDLIQKNTRHYAKRQITWMKRYKLYNFTHEIMMDNLNKDDANDIIISIIKDVYEF
ncbi:MAG: tRNA (adenosine(37)-N6)-dimethylallyltransferase MiaA [Anaerococcus sp.]|uniref:tRNA (adenosine(37)-N6)-dimethylallyltransferase MiaA n=1 Tax=Anaerococcus sp. TaxID=1872515 RepID=UPI0028FEADB9|nr:tRNA (adenosine(37)-N6)-dimethylallyltransferase MiaA [Anaerococcus sp.]MDU2565572.1 tRNA (adenosine(37)-N6)-dimethylallyltransferase MiaA [Anaerococcus sp.]